MVTVLLLIISNAFMTFAWYGHLKYRSAPIVVAIVVSWLIAFGEYCFQVPANRIGYGQFTGYQLKIIQESITLAMFAVFAYFYLGEAIRWNHLASFACIMGAVVFAFWEEHNDVRMTLTLAPDVKEVPGPTSWFPGGNFLAFRRNPLTFFESTARTYGDVARFSFGSQPVYLVSHPAFIEDILVTSAKKFTKGIALQRAKKLLGEGLLTSEGQMHLRQRRTIQPLFHRQQVQGFAEAMVRHGLRWRDTIRDGATIDVTAEMGGLTLAIVGETLFSTNVQRDADQVRQALTDAVQSFAYAVLPGIELFERLPIGPFVKVRKARVKLDRIIHRVIAERRANPDAAGDLIAMLLAARDPENPSAPGMSDQQIRDEAMTIFLAGYETTANAMAWTWHLLGSAPHVEEKLHAELRRVLGDRAPTMAEVPKLEVTRAVIAESMRVYPPAWTMGRRAVEPHVIGGYEIEKNALVLTSQWVVHHDPRWWPDPFAFRPERWLPEARRPKYAYFPFGGGGRLCIGESFAWTEAILLLAAIAQRWSFAPVSAPTPEPRITLRPRGLQMRAVARQPIRS